ncbi:MAG: MmgE/PrpD family protein [Chloroflexi bacterium]|nr:MmgE/PrpD family protein [Chloroflexota bacterium]
MAVTKSKMAVTEVLASHMLGFRYEDLPQQAIEVTKKTILDTLACAVAGSTAIVIEPLAELVKGWGGKQESTVLVYGGKVPAPAAALINCTMARALDFDDVHESGGGHINATMVPSALIIAEYSKTVKGRPISGKELIAALALGCDLFLRIRLAAGKTASATGWTSETYAPIAVAAMGGRMLGFDREKTLNAMGVAYCGCAGNVECIVEGTLGGRLQQGLAGKAGILSLNLTDIGFTGPANLLEGKYGLYQLYWGGDYTPERLVMELGTRFEGNDVSIKPYPSCKYTHGSIWGVLRLVAENGIKASDVEKVTISTSTRTYNIAGCGENKISPTTIPDAQFSYYFTIASALIRGHVTVEDFTEKAINDPEVRALAKKVNVVIDEEKDKVSLTVSPTDIEIVTRGGKVYRKHVEADMVKGHPKNPLSRDEVVRKFRDCAPFSARPFPAGNIDKISQMVWDLEKIDDVTALLGYFG